MRSVKNCFKGGKGKNGKLLKATTFPCVHEPEIKPQVCGCKERQT
jgi:hypothetical protein